MNCVDDYFYCSGGPEVKFVGGSGVDGKKYDCAKVNFNAGTRVEGHVKMSAHTHTHTEDIPLFHNPCPTI